MTIDIRLPAGGWDPREHQKKLWEYLKAAASARSRSGIAEPARTRSACITRCGRCGMRPGNYWHCLPEYAQARKAIWDAVNPHTGKRRIDEAFPEHLRETTREHDMHIRFKNGSTWSCIGSDSYDRTVGASAAGLTYSEYALCNPSAWAYHRPMLEENNGWAIFITTPRGRNHAFDMLNHARLLMDGSPRC